MPFNKITLIFALVAVLFGKVKKNATPDKSRVYFQSSVPNGTVLTINVNDVDGEISDFPVRSAQISDFVKFYTTASVTDANFIVSPKVDDEQFYNQRVAKDLKQEEISCNAVWEAYDRQSYGLYGFAALALENSDIAPSITALIKNGPTLVKYTNIPAGEEGKYEDIPINHDCNGIGYIFTTYGLRGSGVVGTDCIPNTGVPQSATTCVDSKIELTQNLKGYFEAHIFKADTETLKDALIRFGPVAITNEEEPQIKGVLLGWKTDSEQNYWIIAEYFD
ncbi:MAG: hypothetical protein EZS28_040153, partial [Streblomastix strix]